MLLRDGRDGSNDGRRDRRDTLDGDVRVRDNVGLRVDTAVGVLLWAVTDDVARDAAVVADLAGGVQGPTVGGGAVVGDVTKLAAGIALHGLRLAVTGVVVGATALEAGGMAGAASESTAAGATNETTSGDRGSTAHRRHGGGVGASALGTVSTRTSRWGLTERKAQEVQSYHQMANLTTIVAASARSVNHQAESGTIGLDMAETLAMIALLVLGAARLRALGDLMFWSSGLISLVPGRRSGSPEEAKSWCLVP